MRRALPIAAAVFATATLAAGLAGAASHPPGVTYPLKPADAQPSGLAQPLPSTRRYVLVWKDQLADVVEGITQQQKPWICDHYVGTQKLFKHQIDEYRTFNPNFLMLVYHLAYGLNGADQPNPVGNITGAEMFGQEDTDTFTPYVQSHGITRENAFEHGTNTGFKNDRINYPDPFWLMNVDSPEWRSYLFDTLQTWQGYPSTNATGVFLDVAFHPWYNYQPDQWWAGPAGGSSHTALATWWNPRAKAYFKAMRAAFAPSGSKPRYLVIPNPDALWDEEPEFLVETDGVFTENWQGPITSGSPGDWATSAGRIVKYATSAGKVWIAGITATGTSLSQADREMLIGTYLLIRNGTSYFTMGLGDVSWYPEYEIDLGGYDAEPSADIEGLRVAGTGGGQGGLYARTHVAGVVLVNSSNGALDYQLAKAMKRAAWSGGGDVAADATMPPQMLTYSIDVPAGTLSVPARSVIVLQDPGGPPPPGVEPGGGGSSGTGTASGGAGGGSGVGPGSGAGNPTGAGAGPGAGGGNGDGPGKTEGGACSCRMAPVPGGASLGAAALALVAVLSRRRRRRG